MLKVYQSYNFVDKDPIIDEVRTAIQDSGVSYKYIEDKSGVTDQTLRNWFDGRTRRPQACTVRAVLNCLPHHQYRLQVLRDGVPMAKAKPRPRLRAVG